METIPKSTACDVCGDEKPTYSWSDFYGEGLCCQCGAPFQLKAPSGDNPDQEYPYCKIDDKWLPVFRRYWQETQRYNGSAGMFFVETPPHIRESRRLFHHWLEEHSDEFAALLSPAEEPQ